MGSIWTVKPEDVRIDLTYTDPEGKANGFWISVKHRLSVGEKRKVETAGWRGMRGMGSGSAGGPEIQIDWRATTFARAEAYLVDWSLTDDKSVKLALGRDTLEALHPDVYDLIEKAIEAHVALMDAEKKVPTPVSVPSAT